MKQVTFPDGTSIPALGQGTWRLGEDPRRASEEAAAVRLGLDLGLTVIDTAEMYGDGATETFLGRVLEGVRDGAFLVSKAYPQNASRTRLVQACENSLRRLGTDRLDLYLLHWRGRVPLAETVEAMENLVETGKVRMWGVSNFDADDMDELQAAGGTACAANQILYNLSRRGPEFDLLPLLRAQHIPAMAYSPMEQGRLLSSSPLQNIAQPRGLKPLQVALAWALSRDNILVIPKTGTLDHMRENMQAASLELTEPEMAALDAAFPPPRRKLPLDML